jgi:hypothetical protein
MSANSAGNFVSPGRAECRTSDITLVEFRSLRGKMDAANTRARTVQEYLGGTASFRTDLYSGPSSGILADGNNGFYFQSFDSAIQREGNVFLALDVMARQIGVLGVFTDWPATVTFYANCTGLR